MQVLERRDKFRLGASLVLILVGTILEMASLGLVIPVVQAVVSGDRRSEYGWLPQLLQEVSYSRFVQILMTALFFVFLVKNSFAIFLVYIQKRINVSITNRVTQRLFESYVRQPYEYHLQYSSSLLVRNVQEFSNAVVGNGVGPAMTILTECVTGIGLLSVLMFVQPLSTSILFSVFLLAGSVMFVSAKARTRRWGAERVKHRGILLDALMEGFGGIKEIKIFGRGDEVLDTHQRSLAAAAKASTLFLVLQNLPRAIFEVFAVGGIAIVSVAYSSDPVRLETFAVIVALFGVVAFRLLPSANRFIQSLQELSFGRAGIEGAVEGLSLPQQEVSVSRTRPMDKFESLEISNLKYSYPNTESLVTDVSSLRIAAGESVGIIGASGSGKSTLVDLLIGILAPKIGTITVNGRDISADPRYWQDRIGYVPQHVYLMDTTIRRNVAFGLNEKEINDADVEKALRSANLWEFVQSLPARLDTVVGERGVRLSGGQRQRLGIARALYGNPEVIVLDEATSALDADTEREIVESFREIAHDHTLIVVAHRTSTLAYCNRLIRLEAGRIVQEGTFTEVIGSLPNTESRGQ